MIRFEEKKVLFSIPPFNFFLTFFRFKWIYDFLLLMSSAWSHGGASVWRLNGAHTRRIRTHRRRTSASSAATTLGSFHNGTNNNKKGNVENFYNNINMEDTSSMNGQGHQHDNWFKWLFSWNNPVLHSCKHICQDLAFLQYASAPVLLRNGLCEAVGADKNCNFVHFQP